MAAKTQPRTHAAMTGRRYGSFAGKPAVNPFSYTGIPQLSAERTMRVEAARTMRIKAG